jgi:hypothetical protein
MSQYVEKAITLIFTLGAGQNKSFGPNGSNTVTITNHRVAVSVAFQGIASMAAAQITIFNMDRSQSNAIATLGTYYYALNGNTVSVLAGDPINGMSLVYEGNISFATFQPEDMPDVSMQIQSYQGIKQLMESVVPNSFSGAVNVATILQSLCQQAGFTFENNGVSVVLNNPYLSGTLLNQIRTVCKHAGIGYCLDQNGSGGNLAIWPRFGARGTGIIPISPTTGLLQYPSYTAFGVDVRTIFNPAYRFGALVNVQSELQPACGQWAIYGMEHDLEAQAPGGKWDTYLNLAKVGSALLGQ